MPETSHIRVLVVYNTGWGNTGRMADAVARGARSSGGTEARTLLARDATTADVRAAEALIVGSPMRHHGIDSEVRRFLESVVEELWLDDELVGKVAGVFVNGGGYGDAGAGAELTLVSLLAPLAWSGMVLVPTPKTTPGFPAGALAWGPRSRSGDRDMTPAELTDDMLKVAFHHGANIARVTVALDPHRDQLFARGNVAPPDWLYEQWTGRERQSLDQGR